MCFQNYGLRNTCLGKCLKSPLSEDRLTAKGNGVENSLSY